MSGPAMSPAPELGPGPPLGAPGIGIPPAGHHPGHPGYLPSPIGHEAIDRERNGAPEPREQDGRQPMAAFNQFQQNQLRAQIQVYR